MTTYYVDANSAGGDGTTTAITGATAAFALVNSFTANTNDTCKIMRGQTHTTTAQINIGGVDDCTYETYYNSDGSDDSSIDRPILITSNTAHHLFFLGGAGANNRISHKNLELRLIASSAKQVLGAGTNVSADCVTHNCILKGVSRHGSLIPTSRITGCTEWTFSSCEIWQQSSTAHGLHVSASSDDTIVEDCYLIMDASLSRAGSTNEGCAEFDSSDNCIARRNKTRNNITSYYDDATDWPLREQYSDTQPVPNVTDSPIFGIRFIDCASCEAYDNDIRYCHDQENEAGTIQGVGIGLEASSENCKIYSNYVAWGGGSIEDLTNSGAGGNKIFGNVVVGGLTGCIDIRNPSANPTEVHNNLVINLAPTTNAGFKCLVEGGGAVAQARVYNNIFISNAKKTTQDAAGGLNETGNACIGFGPIAKYAEIWCDYNLYISKNSDNCFQYNDINSYGYASLSDYQTAADSDDQIKGFGGGTAGADANSIHITTSDDWSEYFVGGDLFTLPLSGVAYRNYHPNASEDNIRHAGVRIGDFVRDFYGRPFYRAGGYTLGAFEFGPGFRFASVTRRKEAS